MANPDPIEPFDPFESDDATVAARARAQAESATRPDWLVGADAGVEAELARRDRENASDAPIAAPTLRRPEAPADAAPPPSRPSPSPLRLVPGAPAAPAAPAAPEKKAWTAAASSLPTLRVLKGGADPLDAPAPSSRPPDARFAVDTHIVPEPHRAPAPDAEEEDAFPEDRVTVPLATPSGTTSGATRSARLAPPREAWWLVAIDAVRSDRKVQILTALSVVLVAVLLFWPRGEKTLALGEIRHHPASWNGQHVRVSGRIGEVFQVGGGFAFYLHQGHDTLVVFTRSRTPQEQQQVTLVGTVSTGWLDGVPRPTLFEETNR